MRLLVAASLLAFCFCLSFASGSIRPVLTVAAASNVQFALEKVAASFSAAHGAEVKTVYSSSGKLVAQIRNGAPFDAFVSADMAFPDSLVKWGQASGETRAYASGLLVLWTMRADLDPALGLPLLSDPSVRKVAMPDPALAPYGRESLGALEKAGLEKAVRPKLVFAQNIGQTSQFILTGAADIGFNAKSVVLAPEMKGKGKWVELDRDAYRPISQGAIGLRHGARKNPVLMRQYLDYLHSGKAREIFAQYGYLLPDPVPNRP